MSTPNLDEMWEHVIGRMPPFFKSDSGQLIVEAIKSGFMLGVLQASAKAAEEHNEGGEQAVRIALTVMALEAAEGSKVQERTLGVLLDRILREA